jgi:SnoaL-like domain
MTRFTLSLAFLAFTTPAFAEGPRDAVDALIAAMASGDAAAVEATFTPDAGYAYSVDGGLTRGDGFDAWVTSDITGPGAQFRIESATVTDSTVDALVMWGRGGNMTSPARYIFTVAGGKVDSWRMTGR